MTNIPQEKPMPGPAPPPKYYWAGINGNKHTIKEIARYGQLVWQSAYRPLPHGVRYHGDGNWMLPTDAEIDPAGGDDWLLTMPDGAVFYVWSQDGDDMGEVKKT